MSIKYLAIRKRNITRQLISYSVVGVLVNFFGYILYLFFTSRGLSPGLTVTLLYPIGTIFSFFSNRHYTFQHKGNISGSGIRYLGVQLLGYILNLALLLFCVDIMGFPHQAVQAVAIFVVAGFLFFMLKTFVFRNSLS